jgi:zinc protease
MRYLSLIALALAFCCCKPQKASLEYEKYKLENGLEVILHEDKSDPIVAVAIQYRVGSANEKTGKTGFAHFFEHMLFQRSENLPRNSFFSKIDDMGGEFNGGTSYDYTQYYEVVPRDGLEKVLWMESDRMGFFINTVTQGGLEREIDVVSNEKRQHESGPYGHSEDVFKKYYYPEGHPYSWSIIGKIEDLQSATVEDVKEFYRKYYTPANATLVIAGDFDKASTKELVEKYFAEIKGGPKPEPIPVQNVTLDQTRKVYYEDKYATAPKFHIAFPSVEQYHEDTYPLYFLVRLMSGDKKSPMHKIIVEENNLASNADINQFSMAVDGMVTSSMVTYPDVDLDDVYNSIFKSFEKFEQTGVDEKALQRYKTQYEVSLYRRLSAVLIKGNNMLSGNTFAGKPDQVFTEVEKYNAVTAEDIMRVYEKYIKGKNHVVISTVPAGKVDLAVEGSIPADMQFESIEQQKSMSKAGEVIDDPYEYTPSKLDRSIEPGLMANTPEMNFPDVWNMTLDNGIQVKGIKSDESPLVYFSLILNGGATHDPIEKAGVAALTTEMLKEGGTASMSPEDLEEALGNYGANVNCLCSVENSYISGQCLNKDFAQVIKLVSEMILQPAWDEKAFDLAKENTIDYLKKSTTSQKSIAGSVFKQLLWGKDHIFAYGSRGTEETVNSITLDDVKDFYSKYYSPSITKMSVVGDLTEKQVKKAMEPLVKGWEPKEVEMPSMEMTPAELEHKIYFIDYPGSSQSYIVMGHGGLSEKDEDAQAARVVNDKLGASSSALLFDILRLKRGYTYGAYSSFSCGLHNNSFTARSSVQATATKPSVELFREIIDGFDEIYTQEILDNTIASLKKASCGKFENAFDRMYMLMDIYNYGLEDNYLKKREQELSEMTLERAQEVIAKYLDINQMAIVVVGDAKTQYEPLTKLGLEIGLYDAKLNPVK